MFNIDEKVFAIRDLYSENKIVYHKEQILTIKEEFYENDLILLNFYNYEEYPYANAYFFKSINHLRKKKLNKICLK